MRDGWRWKKGLRSPGRLPSPWRRPAAAALLLLLLALAAWQSVAQRPTVDVQIHPGPPPAIRVDLSSSRPTNTYTLMISTSWPAAVWSDVEVVLGATTAVSYADLPLDTLDRAFFRIRESSREDFDGDGLGNLNEYVYGFNPMVADTDGNGQNDEAAIEAACAEATWLDVDGDGYLNVYEIRYATDPEDTNSTPAPVLFVDASAAPGGDGSSNQPFDTIQAALDAAADFDIIRVAAGVYAGAGNTDLDYRGKPVMVTSESGPGDCIIECDQDSRGAFFHLAENADSVMRGLTIRHGSVGIVCAASGPTILDCVVEGNDDQGIRCDFASPRIVNCTVRSNGCYGLACYDSGPVVVGCHIVRNGCVGVESDVSTPTITDCEISQNDGGGIEGFRAAGEVRDCVIERNDGAGLYLFESAPVISGSVIARNTDYGIDAYDSEPVLQDCNIARNDAGGVNVYGGEAELIACTVACNSEEGLSADSCLLTVAACAIASNGDNGVTCRETDLLLERCRVVGNRALGAECTSGGNLDLRSSVVDHNQASAVESANCLLSILNCTLIHNEGAGLELFESEVLVENSILGNNRGGSIWTQVSSVAVTYSCVEGGWSGTNNVAADPLLVPGTWRLTDGSPCIDAGALNAVLTDMDGEARWDHPGHTEVVSYADIGADEFVDGNTNLIADVWEQERFGGPLDCGTNDNDAAGGPDGLSDRQEYESGTDPDNADTDGDGLTDGDEIDLYTDPTLSDTDGDLLYDGPEWSYGLDPCSATDVTWAFCLSDPDEDGFPNVYEYNRGSNPTNTASVPATNLYVDAAAPAGGDGSASSPFARIQDALDAAVAYDVIAVAPGRYAGIGNRDLDFRGKPVLLMSSAGARLTTIDAGNAGAGFSFDEGEDARAIVRGFCIRNAGGPGGHGIEMDSLSCPAIQDCIISGSTQSGVLCPSSPSIENCVIAGCGGTGGQGGIRCNGMSGSRPLIRNCTIVSNAGGGVKCDYLAVPPVENSILCGNSPAQIVAPYAALTASYCCVEGGWSGSGTGNIAADPLMTPVGCRLKSASPCIDAAATPAPVRDIEGEARWDHPAHSGGPGIVDMGADEFVDTDLDGMADAWEMEHFGGLSHDATNDNDTVGGPDGLSDLEEYEKSTDPNDADTDDDELKDGEEAAAGTDPRTSDTDGDGLPDRWELLHALDALVAFGPAETNWTAMMSDADGDGYVAIYEIVHETDPDDPGSAPAPTVYVDAAAAGGGDGSAMYPFRTIQTGLDAAGWYGIVQVQQGTYAGWGNRNLDFKGRAMLLLAEGVPGDCIIDAWGVARGFSFCGGEHAAAIVRGFVIRNAGIGIYCTASPSIQNCVLADNVSNGIECRGTALPELRNCTIAFNGSYGIQTYNTAGAGVLNCILWSNGLSQISALGAQPTVSYSCVQNGCAGDGNTADDPRITPIVCRLRADSACIDAGHSNAPPIDRDGEARCDDPAHTNAVSIVDMGADEFVDNDDDDMADAWEIVHFGGFSRSGTNDNDAAGGPDGLTDLQEYENSTDPARADTDGDGLNDGAELSLGTDPHDPDTDGDGLVDSEDDDPLLNVDADLDGLPDAWELDHFFDLDQTRFTDFDEDGLLEIEEYLAGSDPFYPDADGDGVPDDIEVRMAFSDPNAADFDGAYSEVAAIDGSKATTNQAGGWVVQGTYAFSHGRHGWIEYEIEAPSNYFYVAEVRASQHAPASNTAFALALSADDIYVGEQTLFCSCGTSAVVRYFLPRLEQGAHRLKVTWLYSAPANSLRIDGVRLLTAGGPDTNGNGTVDWIDHRLNRLVQVPAAVTSHVSPACLEGECAALDLLHAQRACCGSVTGVPLQRNSGNRWYANVELCATGATEFVISADSGALCATSSVTWVPLNVLSTSVSSICLREGDALLLAAVPAGATSGAVCIEIEGVTNYASSWDAPVAHRFGEPGEFRVLATWSNDAVVTGAEVNVSVVSAALDPDAAAWIGSARDWYSSNFPPDRITLDADPRVDLSRQGNGGDGSRAYRLATHQRRPLAMVARLKSSGAVLDAVEVRGFRVYRAWETYLAHLETYGDGDRLVEAMIVSEPVLPGVVIRLSIFVSGVLFDDGSVVKDLAAEDFNELGECSVRLIQPSWCKTAVCHSVIALEDGLAIGP